MPIADEWKKKREEGGGGPLCSSRGLRAPC